MARKVFYSFHYARDSWRVAKVRNIGALEGQPLLSSNEWEDVARGGDAAIQRWIDREMADKSCNVVLIGRETAGRRWVNYEITKAWNANKGVVGIYIHNLTDQLQQTCSKGANPFAGIKLQNGMSLDRIVKAYDPPGSTSDAVYRSIAANIESWVEEAITIRKR